MTFTMDPWNNFCRVFEIPEEYPKGYLFGDGKPVNFQMVDWFNTGNVPTAAVSKEVYLEEVGEYPTEEITHEELIAKMTPFLKEKTYTKEGRSYLVLCNFGAAVVIEFI